MDPPVILPKKYSALLMIFARGLNPPSEPSPGQPKRKPYKPLSAMVFTF
jgi:hypothetical protein